MFYTNMQHVHQSRTLKPRYARTQATPQAVQLDPEWDGSKDIFPGSVLSRKANGKVTLADGKNAPAGLCGNWIAPVFGIDEVRVDGNWDVAMWVLDNSAIFAVEAPAFDVEGITAANVAELDAGKKVFLKANENGLLTYDGNTATAQSIAELVGMEGTNIILIAGCSNPGGAEGSGDESE